MVGQKRWMCDECLLCEHGDLPGSSQHPLRKTWACDPSFKWGRDRRIAPGMIEQDDSRHPPLALARACVQPAHVQCTHIYMYVCTESRKRNWLIHDSEWIFSMG